MAAEPVGVHAGGRFAAVTAGCHHARTRHSEMTVDDATLITAASTPRRGQTAARVVLDWLALVILVALVLAVVAGELTGFTASFVHDIHLGG
jgi:hypothetical protein